MHVKSTLIFYCIFLSPFSVKALTKHEALEALQASQKWSLTKTLQEEASQKTIEAESEFRPHTQLAIKQLAARINPIQYGLNNQTDTIDTIAFGSTSLQLEWVIANPVAAAEVVYAKAQSKISGFQMKDYQNDLISLMLISYLNVQKLERQLATTEASLEKSNLILRLATSKKKIGAGIPLDIARAKSLVGLDQVKRVVAYTKLLKSKHELEKLLGLSKISTPFEKLNPQIARPLDPQSYLSTSIDSRVDLKTAETSREMAASLTQSSSKWFLPKLSFFAEAGTSQPNLLGFPAKTLNGAVGVTLIIPLDSGGLISAKRKQAQIASYRAEINFKEKKQEILSQVKESLENLAAAEEALGVARNYILTTTEEADIAEKRFFSGMSNVIDLSSAHTNRAFADDALTDSEFNYEAARINYYRVLGDFKDYL